MKYITLFIIAFLFWLLLSFSLEIPHLIVGVVIALITSIVFGKRFLKESNKFFQPKRYFWILIYLVIFVWECIKANFDVAYRVLSPRMPIKPGIVKARSTLKSEIGKTMLANSITMTPGTITVDVVDDYFYIHWIYVSSKDPEDYTKKILGRFENYIKRIFE